MLAMLTGAGCFGCGFAQDELRFDCYIGGIFFPPFNAIEQRLRCHFAHALQRLPDCRQARTIK